MNQGKQDAAHLGGQPVTQTARQMLSPARNVNFPASIQTAPRPSGR